MICPRHNEGLKVNPDKPSPRPLLNLQKSDPPQGAIHL